MNKSYMNTKLYNCIQHSYSLFTTVVYIHTYIFFFGFILLTMLVYNSFKINVSINNGMLLQSLEDWITGTWIQIDSRKVENRTNGSKKCRAAALLACCADTASDSAKSPKRVKLPKG